MTVFSKTLYDNDNVSIHTPTKGVTDVAKGGFDEIKSFNPHTHEGCDVPLWLMSCPSLGFNPHTHEGCDAMVK